LVANGFAPTVDHRSYARQGKEQIPQIHLGPAASQMERRGIRTDRGDINRAIEISNKEIKQLRARINKLSKWITEESVNTKPPTLADVINEILNRQGQSGITKLKNAAQMLLFLQENQITDMAGLEQKVSTMRSKLKTVNENLKKVERRTETLKKHLEQGGYIKSFRKIKRHHDDLYSWYESARKEKGFFAERKAQKALEAANEYRELHHRELTLYDAAARYMRDVLQDRYDPKKLPPLSMWREELVVKNTEKDSLYQEYYALKDETHKVEKIRASVKEIIQAKIPERVRQKSRRVEL